ncbi:2OG-Fe(II) oxygenase [Gallaecimonas xiamenensis]|uniref:SM-20-related protein n=1 Tax=Gallaecimonas xiamenensis 3-C-1 TaxID=745411 RepID=K2KJJ3_9GAMM|nr:2OG-Fe(II) oxygenase [Gallaecimonas xiamenensis]EKE77485.1 SM-20-related protein [Gallaecimonas xiamenensis 3-C-1]
MGDKLAAIVQGLVDNGYVVLPNWLDDELRSALRAELLVRQDELSRAGIGRDLEHQQRLDVRNDQTLWLDGLSLQQQQYLAQMDELRQTLNRSLFLGLNDFECHFAHYGPGHYYQKHLDAFRGRSNRVVSTVVYLNAWWPQDAGGELAIYDDKDQLLDKVSPQPGTLVCFLSEEFPHEVLPAGDDRYSIAGWFRRDGVQLL